jgi:regulatory protein
VNARALDLAYRYLNRRERTVSELRRHLLAREVDGSAAAAAIEELTQQGYLDDTRFARLFAQDKRELEQWGSERIRRSLLIRGIDRELVEAALSCGADRGENAISEIDQARALLRRRFPTPPQNRRDRERALGVLIRKGYEPELALDALAVHTRDGGDAG